MKEQIIIRPVLQEDFAAWKVLWDGYNAFYGRKRETALSLNITKTTWLRFFDVYEPIYAVLALSSGNVIGLAHYLFHRSTTHINSVCYLQDLFTIEAARGKGVGRALINDVSERAKAGGSPRIYWQTQETNIVAMQLYDKVAIKSGFVVYRKEL